MNQSNAVNTVIYTNDTSAITSKAIKPLTSIHAILLYFGLPAVMMILANHVFYPMLIGFGLTGFESLVVTNTVPMAILFALAIAFTVNETKASEAADIWKRLRIDAFTRKHLLWSIGAFIFVMFISGFFIVPQQMLIESGIIPIPAIVPLLHAPSPDMSAASLSDYSGGMIAGNWSIIILYAIMIFFNITGEELWWRGYILPRQEMVYGRWTWLVHGLMWCGFHVFKYWGLIGLIPVCLVVSWVAQKTRNTWTGIIIHALFNGIGIALVLVAVMGVS